MKTTELVGPPIGRGGPRSSPRRPKTQPQREDLKPAALSAFLPRSARNKKKILRTFFESMRRCINLNPPAVKTFFRAESEAFPMRLMRSSAAVAMPLFVKNEVIIQRRSSSSPARSSARSKTSCGTALTTSAVWQNAEMAEMAAATTAGVQTDEANFVILTTAPSSRRRRIHPGTAAMLCSQMYLKRTFVVPPNAPVLDQGTCGRPRVIIRSEGKTLKRHGDD